MGRNGLSKFYVAVKPVQKKKKKKSCGAGCVVKDEILKDYVQDKSTVLLSQEIRL